MFSKIKNSIKDLTNDPTDDPQGEPSRNAISHLSKESKLLTQSDRKADAALHETMSRITAQTRQTVQHLQTFAFRFLNQKCRKCNTKLLPNFSASAFVKDWSRAADSEQGASICVAECEVCRRETCIGCGDEPVYNRAKAVGDYAMRWCCAEGRMFGMWVLLCRYDDVELQLQAKAAEQQMQKNTQGMGRMNLNGRGLGLPSGFGTRMGPQAPVAKGIGYDDDRGTLMHGFLDLGHNPLGGTPRTALTQAINFKQQDSKTDKVTCLILGLIGILLPNSNVPNLPPELMGMLQMSLVLDKVAELLRNDSLDNVTKRIEVYRAALKFTAKLGRHPDLEYLVKKERFTKRKTAGLQGISEAAIEGKTTNEVLVHGAESASSIATCLENLAQQAGNLLESCKVKGAFNDRGGQAMLEICDEIDALHQELDVAPQYSMDPGKGVKNAEEQYTRYHKENCLVRNDAVIDLLNRDYQKVAAGIVQSPMGRMKKLVTETAIMSTSLPLGVYVKVGETRPDIMKVLVMGPPDSPYAYGLFQFDIVCPRDYPRVPPLVRAQIKGNLNINPNIHADGKVCLSLLGTWADGDAAAQWQPDVSTILQVLVTIQSMIFCEDPWRNEPSLGREIANNSAALASARQYVLRRQPMTVKYMIDWVEQLANGMLPLWEDVVRAHFILNEGKILAKVGGWRKENPEIDSWNGWANSGNDRMSGWHWGMKRNLWKELNDSFKALRKDNGSHTRDG